MTARAKDLRKNETPQEEILWRQLRSRSWADLKFRRQQPIDGYVVDFCCFERRLVVEIDGAIHLNEDQKQYDQQRDEHLQSQGFRVVRIANDEIEQDLSQVLDKIKAFLTDPSPTSGEGR